MLKRNASYFLDYDISVIKKVDAGQNAYIKLIVGKKPFIA